MSRRVTRSQTICVAAPPVTARKHKSEPTKKSGKQLTTITNRQTLHEKATKVSPASNKTSVDDVGTQSQHGKVKKSVTPAKAKKGKRASREVIPVDTDDKQETAGEEDPRADRADKSAAVDGLRFDKTVNVQSEIVHENQQSDTPVTVKSTLLSDATKTSSSNVSRVPNHPLRRSLRLTSKAQSPPTAKVDLPTLSIVDRPLIITGRRRTIYASESTADKNVTSTSNEHQLNSTDDKKTTGGISTGIQPNGKTVRTKAARCRTIDHSSKSTAADDSITGISTGMPQSRRNESADEAIVLSNDLKKVLLNDSNFINVKRKMYEIPLRFNVADVIEKYVTLKNNSNTTHTAHSPVITINYICTGLIEYFDELIGSQLLYGSERVQYECLLEKFPGEAMSTIYPPIYLLRLLVRFNKLLHYHTLGTETLKYLTDQLNEFVMYLDENKSNFFSTDMSH